MPLKCHTYLGECIVFYSCLSPLRNWCAYVVRRNVSCAVQGSVESFQEPVVAPCPAYQPDCQQQVT